MKDLNINFIYSVRELIEGFTHVYRLEVFPGLKDASEPIFKSTQPARDAYTPDTGKIYIRRLKGAHIQQYLKMNNNIRFKQSIRKEGWFQDEQFNYYIYKPYIEMKHMFLKGVCVNIKRGYIGLIRTKIG